MEIVAQIDGAADPERVRDAPVRLGDSPRWNPFRTQVVGGLRRRGTLPVPGLCSGEHAVLLEPHGGGTRVAHRERFRGLLPPLLRGMLRRGARPGFENMNRAPEQRVETGAPP